MVSHISQYVSEVFNSHASLVHVCDSLVFYFFSIVVSVLLKSFSFYLVILGNNFVSVLIS